MSNKIYDILKYIALVFLPALIVFVGVIMQCFNFEYSNIVTTLLTAFDTFLGAILKISSDNYNKEE